MKSLAILAAALAATCGVAQPPRCPTSGGAPSMAVTENAYTPLNFADPKTGEGIGWEYDAFNEIAKRLNLKVEWNLSSWDTMIQGGRSRASTTSAWTASPSPTSARSRSTSPIPTWCRSSSCWCAPTKTRFTDAKALGAGDFLIGAQAGHHQLLHRRST